MLIILEYMPFTNHYLAVGNKFLTKETKQKRSLCFKFNRVRFGQRSPAVTQYWLIALIVIMVVLTTLNVLFLGL